MFEINYKSIKKKSQLISLFSNDFHTKPFGLKTFFVDVKKMRTL